MSQMVNALPICPYDKWCGGCSMQRIPYEEQLAIKEKKVAKLLRDYGKPEPIVGMNFPYYYRNKTHAVLGGSLRGKIVCGTYERGSHRIVNIDACQIEDRECDRIIASVRELMPSFQLEPYNEDTGRGFLRHILVRRAFGTGQIMLILVTAEIRFPARKQLVAALVSAHPKIKTILQNVNDMDSSMVLGERFETLWGPGYIEDKLMGAHFRISPGAFYQVNDQQTKKLYRLAIEMADLKGGEQILDAYCGTGTIGISALVAQRSQNPQSAHLAHLTGVELNAAAVRDARGNAKANGLSHAHFICADAGQFMQEEAANHHHYDLVFMDPPRSGSSEDFLLALKRLAPQRIVYISCDPSTQARDLESLDALYEVKRIAPVDMFPFTDAIECVLLLQRREYK